VETTVTRSSDLKRPQDVKPLGPFLFTHKGGKKMIRLIALAALALAVTTSAEAMSPAPHHQPDGMITHVREACGAGRVRINGVCVARTTTRHVRRAARRCAQWSEGFCTYYH
jgi:hypothetical protein